MSCLDLTKTPAGIWTFALALGVSAASVFGDGAAADGVATAVAVAVATFFGANSSRSDAALILSTVLEGDFTSGAMILRSFKSAISSLFSMWSSFASSWMRMLMQR
jgi:hypothetical protein